MCKDIYSYSWRYESCSWYFSYTVNVVAIHLNELICQGGAVRTLVKHLNVNTSPELQLIYLQMLNELAKTSTSLLTTLLFYLAEGRSFIDAEGGLYALILELTTTSNEQLEFETAKLLSIFFRIRTRRQKWVKKLAAFP